MKPFKIFIPVWGSKHLRLLERALIKSFSWPKNQADLQDAEWVIVTGSSYDLMSAGKIIEKVFPDPKIRMHVEPKLMSFGTDSGEILIKPLLFEAKDCIENNKAMLMATPDFIYGDGTIDAFRKIAHEPGTCATIAHLRVLPTILNSLDAFDMISNATLMDLAWHHPHISWSEANKRSYRGGVVWEEIDPSFKAVRHFMPSPFFYNFLEEDLNTLGTGYDGFPAGFGNIDHVWPSFLLERDRLRFIGSSDVAMMAEVTDEKANVPPLNEPGQKGFFRDRAHNKIQPQFVSIFRGI